MREHSISLRLKIRPELVEGLDRIRRQTGFSMNEAINHSLTIALEAQENQNDSSTCVRGGPSFSTSLQPC